MAELAEIIREKVDPAALVAQLIDIVFNEAHPVEVRLKATGMLANYGWGLPVLTVVHDDAMQKAFFDLAVRAD
jgi:hypothetical protein